MWTRCAVIFFSCTAYGHRCRPKKNVSSICVSRFLVVNISKTISCIPSVCKTKFSSCFLFVFLQVVFLQVVCLTPVFAVEVIRESKTVSVSGLESPAGAGKKSAQVYPIKRKVNDSDDVVRGTGRANTIEAGNDDFLAASDSRSDFVDAPNGYDDSSEVDDSADVRGTAERTDSVDASLPLDQIPVDKINQNSVPAIPDSRNPQWELVRQIATLQQEISELRGKLEQQSQQISVMESQQKQRYLDLDSRLEALQGSISISSGAQAAAVPSSATSPADEDQSSSSDAPAITSSSQPSAQSAKPKVVDPAGSVNMLKAYEDAQALLKEKKLKSAKTAFNQFIKDYPDENLTGDAHYWLGEIHLASQPSQEAAAKTAFTNVVDSFADSKKTPHALYKLALLEIRGGSKARAKTLLLRLRKDHSTSAPAKLVDAQLKYLKDNP